MKYLGLLVEVLCAIALICGSTLRESGQFFYVAVCVLIVLKVIYDGWMLIKKK